ncbi:MAG TPA: hypothetical protein VKB18_10205 [Gemmatimonadota bacterium]|nr:hypothetical protein [Gemmatimonadota bacterium]
MGTNRAGRPARIWGLRLRWFGAEFLVVVSGVLVAIALNSWYQGRRDAATEATYLALLSRDVDHTIADLREAAAFERSQELNGITAYRAFSARRAGPEPDSVRRALTELLVRRTATLSKATYEDLLSTGNLGLIGDRALRDRIVRFYDASTTLTEILNRNNAAFVDGLYNQTLLASGLILPWVLPNPLGGRGLSLADSLLVVGLRGGYDDEPDPLWSLPREDPAWARARSVLLTRTTTASVSRQSDESMLEQARALKRALDAERRRLGALAADSAAGRPDRRPEGSRE